MLEAFEKVGEIHEARPSKKDQVYGYFKRPPEVTTNEFGRPVVRVEYVFGEWSAAIHKVNLAK